MEPMLRWDDEVGTGFFFALMVYVAHPIARVGRAGFNSRTGLS